MREFDAIIVGAAPACLTAGIYLARARQRVLMVDQSIVGGQVILTHAVANYPGLPETSGYQLAATMRKQVEQSGCTILSNAPVTGFDFKGRVKHLTTKREGYRAKAAIVAAGGDPRTLGLESETRLRGKGISYCATCDGDFFTGQQIVVVGGGNSALEEAVPLTTYASKVTVLRQFDHFQAYAHAIEEARNNPKIHFIMETEVEEFIGDESLTAVRIRSKRDGPESVIPATGAFIFIGYVPKTRPFADCVELTPSGEIVVDDGIHVSLEEGRLNRDSCVVGLCQLVNAQLCLGLLHQPIGTRRYLHVGGGWIARCLGRVDDGAGLAYGRFRVSGNLGQVDGNMAADGYRVSARTGQGVVNDARGGIGAQCGQVGILVCAHLAVTAQGLVARLPAPLGRLCRLCLSLGAADVDDKHLLGAASRRNPGDGASQW